MKAPATALLLTALASAVSGCAARQAFLDRVHTEKRAQRGDSTAAPPVAPAATADAAVTTGPGNQPKSTDEIPAAVPNAAKPAASVPAPATSDGVPPGMQFLYGSGEAAALDYQAYLGLFDLIIAKSSDRAVGQEVPSVVLTPDATLAAPKYVPCGNKPLAVVLDIDETALLNLGYEADDAQHPGRPFDQSRWDRWERTGQSAVVATPGMAEVARVARSSKVALVFNSNRQAGNAAATAAALDGAGLGPVEHGKTLWLQGDAGGGNGKDARRAAIAAKYCVIAMAGDQLGDFSDLFNTPASTPAARRALATGTRIKSIWGHGWFVLPNPIYGTAIKGGMDEIFPANKRWTPGDTAAAQPAPGQ